MKKGENISFDNIGAKLPFTVPENYFEQFANQFDDQIAVKPVPILKLMRPWLYFAAMFIGIFFMSKIGYTVYQNNKTTNAENYDLYVISQVNDAEIFDYLSSLDANN